MSRLSGMQGEATVNLNAIADGDEAAATITVPGAKLGDFVLSSIDVGLQTTTLSASVTSDDTVTAVVANNTGGSIDLPSAKIRVKVVPYDVI